MWNVARDGSRINIETAVGIIELDAERGGQITRFAVKDQKRARRLLPQGRCMPGLVLTLDDGTVWRLADCRAAIEVTRQDSDSMALIATAKMGDGALTVDLEYEVFADGALFCNFILEFAEGRSVTVRHALLETQLDLAATVNARWGYISRYPWVKQDATTVHAFNHSERHLPLSQAAELNELLALVMLDMGWDNTRFFSNRIELLLEDWSALGSEDFMKDTRTTAGGEDGRFVVRWDLCAGGPRTVPGGYRYRNRWGLLFAGSRHLCGEGDTARRNNAMGARVCHCIYPYVRVEHQWPWAAMPIKQVKAQPPMLFKGNPGLQRVDEAAVLGTNLMIIHQFWMSNPGSNNEPAADYLPHDPAWLRAFVDHCHKRGMRVLIYGRATEMWQHYATFFEEFCKPDYDGLYLDWSTPFAHGYVKGSMAHTSAYAFYCFHRALRKRVGAGGIIIGHTGTHTQLACNLYDAEVSGEFSVLHEVLLGEPEACACYGIHGGVGGNLLGGGVKDRGMFMSDRAVAFCAAMGMSSHVIMSPDTSYQEDAAYIKPLWDARRSLTGSPVRVFNPTQQPVDGITCDNHALFPVVYLNQEGQALLIVANLGDRPSSGKIELDIKELGISAANTSGADSIKPLGIDGTHGCAADGWGVSIDDIPPDKFSAALIG